MSSITFFWLSHHRPWRRESNIAFHGAETCCLGWSTSWRLKDENR